MIKYDVTQIRAGRWAVRPAGQLGTCGFHPFPWTVVYVNAQSAGRAFHKAGPRLALQRATGRALANGSAPVVEME